MSPTILKNAARAGIDLAALARRIKSAIQSAEATRAKYPNDPRVQAWFAVEIPELEQMANELMDLLKPPARWN